LEVVSADETVVQLDSLRVAY
jgi:hypothetical protein